MDVSDNTTDSLSGETRQLVMRLIRYSDILNWKVMDLFTLRSDRASVAAITLAITLSLWELRSCAALSLGTPLL